MPNMGTRRQAGAVIAGQRCRRQAFAPGGRFLQLVAGNGLMVIFAGNRAERLSAGELM